MAAGGTVPMGGRESSEKRVQADAPKCGCVPSVALPCSLRGAQDAYPWNVGAQEGWQPRVKEAGRSEFLEVLAGCPQTQLRVELEDLRKRGTVKGQSDGGGY